MILVFLGSMRATVGGVSLGSAVRAGHVHRACRFGDNSINAMVLGGLALAFSRLIDNSVVVLENIFRHMEMGETPGGRGGERRQEVALPVLAATLTTAIVFFPVIFLYGVSRFLFTRSGACRRAVAVRLLLRGDDGRAAVLREADQGAGRHTATRRTRRPRAWSASTAGSTRKFQAMLSRYDRAIGARAAAAGGDCGRARWACSCSAWPAARCSAWPIFPRTDPGQFVINLKAPTGTQHRHHRGAGREGREDRPRGSGARRSRT